MFKSMRQRSLSFLLGAGLFVGFLAGPLGSQPAMAAFTTCKSDPTVALSNGAVLDLQAQIGDSTSDVKSVVYTVHVPAGTQVISIVKTGGILGVVETVNVYADDAANTYDTTTTAYTGQSTSVTATSTAVSVLGVTLGTALMSGTSGQALHSHFTSLL